MSEPVILFGVGATKAGTSWLHRYLSDHPECHFRAIKELHYFNSFDWNELNDNVDRVKEIRDRLRAQAKSDLPPGRLANKVRQLSHVEHYLEVLALGHEDQEAYLSYLSTGQGEAKVIGEITPAYSLLSEGRLRAMARIAPNVRFVYLLRDPIERLWSHVRMMADRRAASPSEMADRAASILKRVIGGQEDEIARRSDYANALARLNAAVSPKNLCVAVYEQLFSARALDGICTFLGISPLNAVAEKVIHAGVPLEISSAQRRAAAEWLAPQYDAARVQLGALPREWAPEMVGTS